MRKKIIAANWKMNGQTDLNKILINRIQDEVLGCSADVVICPPSLYLPGIHNLLHHHQFSLGAQNIYPKDNGAYTGEISCPMLKDFGCRVVIVGHSERRTIFQENEKIIAEKFHHVKEHDMIPILCVGETLEERNSGQTDAVLERQLSSVLRSDSRVFKDVVIAYEPVWAIGTGKSATPEQIQDVHAKIRQYIEQINKEDADCLSLLYGGSVTEKNAASIFEMKDVDGGLIGGASLNAHQFVEIVKCIN